MAELKDSMAATFLQNTSAFPTPGAGSIAQVQQTNGASKALEEWNG